MKTEKISRLTILAVSSVVHNVPTPQVLYLGLNVLLSNNSRKLSVNKALIQNKLNKHNPFCRKAGWVLLYRNFVLHHFCSHSRTTNQERYCMDTFNIRTVRYFQLILQSTFVLYQYSVHRLFRYFHFLWPWLALAFHVRSMRPNDAHGKNNITIIAYITLT